MASSLGEQWPFRVVLLQSLWNRSLFIPRLARCPKTAALSIGGLIEKWGGG